MSEIDVEAYLDTVGPAGRRSDADTLLGLMRRITGEPGRLWYGRIVGFGEYHYAYASGREGDGPAAAFAPTRAASTIYLPDGAAAHSEALQRLGPHKASVGCLYITRLDDVDLATLEEIVAASYATLTAGIYGFRARETGTAEG